LEECEKYWQWFCLFDFTAWSSIIIRSMLAKPSRGTCLLWFVFFDRKAP
jgi:hypothetical protein